MLGHSYPLLPRRGQLRTHAHVMFLSIISSRTSFVALELKWLISLNRTCGRTGALGRRHALDQIADAHLNLKTFYQDTLQYHIFCPLIYSN
jgi:hypothetical protein